LQGFSHASPLKPGRDPQGFVKRRCTSFRRNDPLAIGFKSRSFEPAPSFAQCKDCPRPLGVGPQPTDLGLGRAGPHAAIQDNDIGTINASQSGGLQSQRPCCRYYRRTACTGKDRVGIRKAAQYLGGASQIEQTEPVCDKLHDGATALLPMPGSQPPRHNEAGCAQSGPNKVSSPELHPAADQKSARKDTPAVRG
jgi:hypothetical protein